MHFLLLIFGGVSVSKDDVDLGFALGLPPEKAIAYFASKGYKTAFNWQDIWQEAHTKAFTVAGILKQDILEDIRRSLAEAQAKGTPYREWAKGISKTLYDKGWLGAKAELIGDDNGELLGKRLTPHRLKTIYHTNMRTSAMAGKYQAMIANAEHRPYWQYSAINDDRTRPTHSALNGKIYRYDDPFWDYFYPPNGWNCRCTVIALDERTMTRKGWQASKSTPEQFVEIEQIVGKEKRKAVGFKLGQNTTFAADAGFGYNVGKSHLANLGKTMLDKGVGADPLTSSIAINHAFANPKLIQEITDDFAAKVAIIKANIEQGIAKPTGQVWHIGALVPAVIKKLAQENIELQSGIISVSDREIYHLFRTNKAKRQHKDKVVDKRLPEEFIADLPKYLWHPKAVIQDLQQREPTLLYLYDSPAGKVVIRLNYQLKVGKAETIRTNLVTSGEIVLDETTLRSKNYKILWGYL